MQVCSMLFCLDSFLIWISSHSSCYTVWRILAWPDRMLLQIEHAQGLFSAFEKYKIHLVPLPVRKPVSKQDLEIAELSVYWVSWDTAQLCFTEYQQRNPPDTFWNRSGWVGDMARCILRWMSLEDLLWFMLVRKIKFSGSFISIVIILW